MLTMEEGRQIALSDHSRGPVIVGDPQETLKSAFVYLCVLNAYWPCSRLMN